MELMSQSLPLPPRPPPPLKSESWAISAHPWQIYAPRWKHLRYSLCPLFETASARCRQKLFFASFGSPATRLGSRFHIYWETLFWTCLFELKKPRKKRTTPRINERCWMFIHIILFFFKARDLTEAFWKYFYNHNARVASNTVRTRPTVHRCYSSFVNTLHLYALQRTS